MDCMTPSCSSSEIAHFEAAGIFCLFVGLFVVAVRDELALAVNERKEWEAWEADDTPEAARCMASLGQ